MSSNPDQSEKTEPPSPYKLEQAREKGNVVKSMEMNAFMGMVVGLLFLMAMGGAFIEQTLTLCRRIFSQAGVLSFDQANLMGVGSEWLMQALSILAPLVAMIMVVGILVTMLQTGLIFSTFAIKPDFKRLNPVNGFKKFISIKILFELLKTLVKITIFALVLYFTLVGLAAEIFILYQKGLVALMPFFLDQAFIIISRLLMVMAVFAIIDYMFVRWDYMRQMRMTPKEVKDEHKRRDGDPQIRKKRKEIQNELLKKSQSMGDVSDGDVVITNPTHYAVVLKYDRDTMLAPIVLVKGAGELAKKIRQQARKSSVPMIRSPRLTRKLYREVNIEHPIGKENFVEVAKIFNQAYLMKQQSITSVQEANT